MAPNIELTGWSKHWLERTLPTLHCETTLVVYILTIISLVVGTRALLRVRRCRKDLEADPSNRVAIMSDCDKVLHKSTKTIFYLAHIYLFHALVLWITDAVIGLSIIYEDVDSNPEDYTPAFWLNLAIACASMLAIFSAVFIIFPLLQLMGVAHLVKRTSRKTGDGTLAAYLSEGRIITTHLAQLWLMIGFCVVAWWPALGTWTMARLIVLEAVFGSGLAWLNASFAFNFRPEALCKVQIDQPLGVKDHVKLYGKQVVAVYTEKSELLPKYEDAPQSEKTGL